jgi:hypothetical protein
MMEGTDGEAREVRAARNQSLFRAVNERLRVMNEAFEEIAGSQAITCECADLHCIEQIKMTGEEYDRVRESPRRFVVLRDHVYSDVERVVGEYDGYQIVEKTGVAGEIAEAVRTESA